MSDAAAEIESLLATLYHPELKYIDLSLDRIRRLDAALGGLEKKLPPAIHVAGTNGKGSLIANLQAIFEAAGLRVHRFISPHLVRFNERIVLAGKEIGDEPLLAYMKKVAALSEEYPVTFFEAATMTAFLAFADEPADVLLLETGLGGRLDATNILHKPALTAITPVSFDHCRHLGDTLAQIAGEKAGILKEGVTCVIGRQEKEALQVIEAKAKGPLYRYGIEWQRQGNTYLSPRRTMDIRPGLAGDFQFDNAATAIACIDQLPQFAITDAHIAKGLQSVRWPGRLQTLASGKYKAMLPPEMTLVLDGGHNPQGAEMLAAWLKEQNAPQVHLICGMVQGKDSDAFMRILAPHVTAVYAVAIPDEEMSQSAAAIEEAARKAGIAAFCENSLQNALQSVARHAKTRSIACIGGSLYLAGHVLATN